MCSISHGKDLNKLVDENVEEESPFKLDGKLDNIFEIDGYRIRRYVDENGEDVITIIKKIGTERKYNCKRGVTIDEEIPPLYVPKLR